MLRRNSRHGGFKRWLGVAYMLFQTIGISIGCVLAYVFTHDGGNLVIEDSKYVFHAMALEAWGSCIFILIFLI